MPLHIPTKSGKVLRVVATLMTSISGIRSPSIAANVPPRLRQIPTATPPHIARSQADHERLLAAIESGDSGEAERLMSGHVLATKQRLNDAVIRS